MVHTLKYLRLPSLRLPIARKDVVISERSYVHAEPPQTPPPVAVQVSHKSQLITALRHHARPIVIEDPEVGRPFVRLLRAREFRLRAVSRTESLVMNQRTPVPTQCSNYMTCLPLRLAVQFSASAALSILGANSAREPLPANIRLI